MEQIPLEPNPGKCFRDPGQQAISEVADGDLQVQVSFPAPLHGMRPGIGTAVESLLKEICIGRNWINPGQNRMLALEDLVVCPLANAGKANCPVELLRPVCGTVQDSTDASDRNMLMEDVFQKSQDALYRGCSVQGQGQDHLFEERIIGEDHLLVFENSLAQYLGQFGRIPGHGRNLTPQSIYYCRETGKRSMIAGIGI